MLSKTCVCGQLLWDGDRYCVACGRRVTWDILPQPKAEATKILKSEQKNKNK